MDRSRFSTHKRPAFLLAGVLLVLLGTLGGPACPLPSGPVDGPGPGRAGERRGRAPALPLPAGGAVRRRPRLSLDRGAGGAVVRPAGGVPGPAAEAGEPEIAGGAGPQSAVRRVFARQPDIRRVLTRRAGDPQGAGLTLPPVLHAGIDAVTHPQGAMKRPASGGAGRHVPDVMPDKVTAGAAVHVVPLFVYGHFHHLTRNNSRNTTICQ